MKIEKNEEGIVLRLNNKFYKIDAIHKAIKEFDKVCSGEVSEDNRKFLVTLKPTNKEINDSNLAYEFCNYVLSLMKDSAF